MNLFRLCFSIFAVVAPALFLAPSAADAQLTPERFVAGELLVRFEKGTGDAAFADAHRRTGARLLEKLGGTGWQRIRLPEGLDVKEAVGLYSSLKGVGAVQPNYYYRLAVTPDDTRFSEQYGLAKISAPAAWDLETGSSETVVAVIDTGIKYTHPDLAANIWTNPGETAGNGVDDDGNGFVDDFYGYDFRYDDPDPLDEHGHGTHVAGTIGAVGNNALGVTGVNWNVRLMTIKIYSASGLDTTSAMLVNAYEYVRLMKERGVNIRVTNNSYAGCNEACGYDQATKDALDALGAAGILNVFAAGNDARDTDAAPVYPGSYATPEVLTVGASNQTDARVAFSNWGVRSVDLAAPGVGILSTVMHAAEYATSSGTSMAAPHVAGAAALLSARNPALSALSLKATLLNTVDEVAAWDGFVRTGGRLNVFGALQDQTVCQYALSETSLAARTKGGVYSVEVTAPPNCDYTVRSDDRWIYVLDDIDGSYSGTRTIRFRVTVNPTIARTGRLSVAGREVTVTQSRQ